MRCLTKHIGPIVSFGGGGWRCPRQLHLHGPLHPSKPLEVIFYDYIGMKANTTQTRLIYSILIIFIFLLI